MPYLVRLLDPAKYYWLVVRSGKYGAYRPVLSLSGPVCREIVPAEMTRITHWDLPYRQGFFLSAERDGLLGLYDDEGRAVLPHAYRRIELLDLQEMFVGERDA